MRHTAQTIAELLTAAGTFAAVVAAIWGDRIKDCLFGPRLTLALVDDRGAKIPRLNGTHAYFYHIRVTNRRRSVARSVQVRVQRIAKRVPGGDFLEQQIVCPHQLEWTPTELRLDVRNVFGEDICDFGFLDFGATAFSLSTRWKLLNFPGDVAANESARFEIIASGENLYFSEPLVLEVNWDGKWANDRDEMRQHLAIKPVKSLF
jgi:hypothetical protein